MPACGEQRLDLTDDLFDDVLGVADDRHVGAADLALLGRVDVDVDHLGLLREGVDLAGDAVVEAGAERDQQIALLHRRDRRCVAVHARHAQTERVVVGERAASHQRGHDVAVEQLRELAQRLGRACFEDAAAGVDDRALRFEDETCGLLDHPWVALGVRPVPGERIEHVLIAGPVPRHLVLQHVLRDIDQCGAGAAGGGDVERLANRHRDVVGRHDELVVLGARAGDPDGVALLERVGADRCGRDLTGDRHHRHRVHVRVHQRGDEVGRGRTGGHHRDARLAGHVRVALGHVAGALLVTHEHVTDLAVHQRVVGGQDAAAGVAEDQFDVLVLECSDQRLGAGESFGHVNAFVCWCSWWRGGSGWSGTAPKKQTTSRLGGRSTRSGRPGVLLDEYYEQARECGGGRRHVGHHSPFRPLRGKS